MTSFARLKPFYATLNIRNNALDEHGANVHDPVTSADTTIFASISESYNSPLLDKASDYIMCVERMELSLNGIPFYDARTDVESIVIQSRNTANSTQEPVLKTAYTLSNLLTILSGMEFVDPDDHNSHFFITYTITKDGYIKIDMNTKNFSNLEVQFPRRLNLILGITTTKQVATKTTATSSFTRLDLGDDMGQVVIQSNLPTFTDSVGNERMPILTDFAVPSTYSSSVGYDGLALVQQSWSMSLRDKLIYFPPERRYLELNGDFPVQNITISAWYVNATGTVKPVPLPLGGIFQIKLGFYLKQ